MSNRIFALAALLTMFGGASGQESPLPRQVDLTGRFQKFDLKIRNQGARANCGTFAVTPDYGNVQIALDGKSLARPFDLYSGMVGPSGSLELGTHELTAGKHLMRFSAAKKNAASENYFFGLDTIDLLPAEK